MIPQSAFPKLVHNRNNLGNAVCISEQKFTKITYTLANLKVGFMPVLAAVTVS